MAEQARTILIMAGGTGGHIFPALSIATKLLASGARVEWLGATAGLENEIIGDTPIPLHTIGVRGLRGKRIGELIQAPIMLVRATLQALAVMRKVQPHCALGMGGFVTGPGGLAARLTGCPLLIHEQNAVAGLTNRMLAPLASRILEAFPSTYGASGKVYTVGNPVRQEIVSLGRTQRTWPSSRGLRLLVLGGSQGAQAINQLLPRVLGAMDAGARPEVLHQAGAGKLVDTIAEYEAHGIAIGTLVRVTGFIDDMAEAYRWADLVVCRSGASTVAELAAAGLPSILIPYPYHRDHQQLRNAQWLSAAGAAVVMEQADLTVGSFRSVLVRLSSDRQNLASMSRAAVDMAITDADSVIVRHCLEVADG